MDPGQTRRYRPGRQVDDRTTTGTAAPRVATPERFDNPSPGNPARGFALPGDGAPTRSRLCCRARAVECGDGVRGVIALPAARKQIGDARVACRAKQVRAWKLLVGNLGRPLRIPRI